MSKIKSQKEKSKKTEAYEDENWFEQSEHESIRACTCFCGHIFKSQARNLQCLVTEKVKDKNGQIVLGKEGKPKTERVTVSRRLSKVACSKCSSNWIKDFK